MLKFATALAAGILLAGQAVAEERPSQAVIDAYIA